jgi:N12 class adenine-specific DNA methylase
LADAMGLGKTLSAIALVYCALQHKLAAKAVVVVPSSLVDNWRNGTRAAHEGCKTRGHLENAAPCLLCWPTRRSLLAYTHFTHMHAHLSISLPHYLHLSCSFFLGAGGDL